MIAEVTSVVATGDLTRSITVEAEGELADLKDNINAMVGSLRETTEANTAGPAADEPDQDRQPCRATAS